MGPYARLAVSGSLLLLLGCGAAGSPAGDRTGTVVGTVQLRACGGPPPPPSAPPQCLFRPLAGALVELDASGRTVNRVSTDANGRYSVRIAAGTYSVRVVLAQSSPMLTDSRTVKVDPGQRVRADFQLTFNAL